MRVNLRLLAARMTLPLGGRGRGIEELFVRTAAAFGSPVPPQRSRSAAGRLREYALFTRDKAEAALGGGGSLRVLDNRLFDAALALGRSYRRRLGLRDLEDAMAAARLIYRCLSIDFRGSTEGEVSIRKCSFAPVYTPKICVLMSAIDRGLLAGLTGGGQLQFKQRITEGADSCRAYFAEARR